MKLKAAIAEYDLTSANIIRYMRAKRMKGGLSQPAISRIVSGYRTATADQKNALKRALTFFGVPTEVINRIPELI